MGEEDQLPKRRIVRVGGSLLEWSTLPERLTAFLAEDAQCATVLTVGGGPWVDLLRKFAPTWQLSDKDAHWLSIRALSVTAQILAARTTFRLVQRLDEVEDFAGAVTILDVQDFLSRVEPELEGHRLPESWDVTSDSIAARLTQAWKADECVLLKSCSTSETSLDRWVRDGLVDAFFPQAAEGLNRIRWVNLREMETGFGR